MYHRKRAVQRQRAAGSPQLTQPSRPVWRSNWSLVENGELDDPSHHSYSTPEAAALLASAPLVPPESGVVMGRLWKGLDSEKAGCF